MQHNGTKEDVIDLKDDSATGVADHLCQLKNNSGSGVTATSSLTSIPPLLPINSMANASGNTITLPFNAIVNSNNNGAVTGINNTMLLQSLLAPQLLNQHLPYLQQIKIQQTQLQNSNKSFLKVTDDSDDGSTNHNCVDQDSEIGSEDNPLCIIADEIDEETPTQPNKQSCKDDQHRYRCNTNVTPESAVDETEVDGRRSSMSFKSTHSSCYSFAESPLKSPPVTLNNVNSVSSNGASNVLARSAMKGPQHYYGNSGQCHQQEKQQGPIAACKPSEDSDSKCDSSLAASVASRFPSSQPTGGSCNSSDRGSTEDERENRQNELREYEKKVFNYDQAMHYLKPGSTCLEAPLCLPLHDGGRKTRSS